MKKGSSQAKLSASHVLVLVVVSIAVVKTSGQEGPT